MGLGRTVPDGGCCHRRSGAPQPQVAPVNPGLAEDWGMWPMPVQVAAGLILMTTFALAVISFIGDPMDGDDGQF